MLPWAESSQLTPNYLNRLTSAESKTFCYRTCNAGVRFRHILWKPTRSVAPWLSFSRGKSTVLCVPNVLSVSKFTTASKPTKSKQFLCFCHDFIANIRHLVYELQCSIVFKLYDVNWKLVQLYLALQQWLWKPYALFALFISNNLFRGHRHPSDSLLSLCFSRLCIRKIANTFAGKSIFQTGF